MRPILLVLCLLTTAAAACPAQQAKTDEPIYPVGKDVKPPRAISTPAPDVSLDARRAKFNGVVVVNAYIGTDGKVHDAKVVRSIGDSILDGKALDTVKKWKFHPCTREGKPVNCEMNFEVAFDLH